MWLTNCTLESADNEKYKKKIEQYKKKKGFLLSKIKKKNNELLYKNKLFYATISLLLKLDKSLLLKTNYENKEKQNKKCLDEQLLLPR